MKKVQDFSIFKNFGSCINNFDLKIEAYKILSYTLFFNERCNKPKTEQKEMFHETS